MWDDGIRTPVRSPAAAASDGMHRPNGHDGGLRQDPERWTGTPARDGGAWRAGADSRAPTRYGRVSQSRLTLLGDLLALTGLLQAVT